MTEELRIVLLDDVGEDIELIEQELRSAGLAFTSRHVDNSQAFVDALVNFHPTLILSDYALPSFDGMSALSLAQDHCPSVPFICVSGAIGEELAIEMIKSGATDYVLKQKLSRLVPAVRRALREVAERTERQRAEEAILQSREQLRALAARLQSVREEERTMIAREIHDELGQALTGLKMDVAWLEGKLPSQDTRVREKLNAISQLADSTIQTVRKIATELRPGILDDLGLAAAIEWQGSEFEKRTSIKCNVEADAEGIRLDQQRTTAIFRIFQETLTNVSRHAKASRVKVRLHVDAGTIVLEVADNGKGITGREIADTKSLGLLGMKERALIVGGAVSISGPPGKGTTVTVRVPLQDSKGGKSRT